MSSSWTKRGTEDSKVETFLKSHCCINAMIYCFKVKTHQEDVFLIVHLYSTKAKRKFISWKCPLFCPKIFPTPSSINFSKTGPGDFPDDPVVKTLYPMQGEWVQFPVRELRSCMYMAGPRNKNKIETENSEIQRYLLIYKSDL